jgi:RNA polymerase sigma factor (sigma-70 family)
MDEVQELCLRVLGEPASTQAAAEQARAGGGEDRIALLAAAVRACREHADPPNGPPPAERTSSSPEPAGLAASVAQELALATARLPERQREALALRELLRLSYEQIAPVIGIEPAAVAPLLARARLRLRAERRGAGEEQGAGCLERDRALRVLACRQDSEPLSADDDRWLLAHMAVCPACETAHAAMLEASVCYRAWSHG